MSKKTKKPNSQSSISNRVAVPPFKFFNHKRAPFLWLIALLIVTCLLYSNSLHYEILDFDDNEYFANYPEITHLSWNSIRAYFTHYYLIMYQPLAVLSFAITYYFSQLDTLPLHLGNLVLHLLNIGVIYLFIYNLCQQRLIAIIVATLFALHPMNVEAVTWISARSSGLYTLFYTISLIFYLKYLHFQQKKYWFFAIAAFTLSLFSKAQAVTLPIVLLVIDYYFSRLSKKNINQVLLEKIPFIILSMVFGTITLLDKDTLYNITQGMMVSYTLPESFCLICYSVLFYLYKFFMPVQLCAIYVYPPKIHGMLPMLYYASPLILMLLLYAMYRLALCRKYIAFGLLIFFITLSINIQIIPSRLFIVSERYAYFPYVGLYFILASFFSEFREKNINWQYLFWGLLGVYTCVFAIGTVQRVPIWKDNIVFMSDIIEKNYSVPYLSRAYGTRGIALQRKQQLQAALVDYNKAIEIYPDDTTSYLNRALLFAEMKDFPAAIKDLNQAIKLQPRFVDLYLKRGGIHYQMQHNQDALSDFEHALKLNPRNVEAYNMRAIIRFAFANYQGAETDFSTAIKIAPNNSELYKNRGVLSLKTQNRENACKDFLTASRLGNPEASKMLQQYCTQAIS